MRISHSLFVVLLALFSLVSAEGPVRFVATIPNTTEGLIEPRQSNNVEVTGFITKNGDIFELSESSNMGSIESRQESDIEPAMNMCQYGTIVVYSDIDCNTFFKPSLNLGVPVKTIKRKKEDQSDVEQTEDEPLKKKKTKAKKRKSTNNKIQKQKKKNSKRKSPVRRKALKKRGNNKRRRNNLSQKQKRRKTPQKKNKQRNQRRGNKKNVKTKRITNTEWRSDAEPLEFTLLYDRG